MEEDVISNLDDSDFDDDYYNNLASEEEGSEDSSEDESEESDESEIDQSRVVKKKRKEKLILNVSCTMYPVVREVGKNLGFRLSEQYLDNPAKGRTDDYLKYDFDLMWFDGGVAPDRLAKMKSHQRTNHYPGMYILA